MRGPRRVVFAAVAGWRTVEVDHVRSTVRVPQGVVLDLGATAKALAADRAAAGALRGRRLRRACGHRRGHGDRRPRSGSRLADPGDRRSPGHARRARSVDHAELGRARHVEHDHAALAGGHGHRPPRRRPVDGVAGRRGVADRLGQRLVVPRREHRQHGGDRPRRGGGPLVRSRWRCRAGSSGADGSVVHLAGWPAEGDDLAAAVGGRRGHDMTVALAVTGPSLYWYLARGTGAVALVLLTISVVLGDPRVAPVRGGAAVAAVRDRHAPPRRVAAGHRPARRPHRHERARQLRPDPAPRRADPVRGELPAAVAGAGHAVVRHPAGARRDEPDAPTVRLSRLAARSTGSPTRAGRSPFSTAWARAATRRCGGCSRSRPPASPR